MKAKAVRGTEIHVVIGDDVARRQLSQWQWSTQFGNPTYWNRIAPQRQRPSTGSELIALAPPAGNSATVSLKRDSQCRKFRSRCAAFGVSPRRRHIQVGNGTSKLVLGEVVAASTDSVVEVLTLRQRGHQQFSAKKLVNQQC